MSFKDLFKKKEVKVDYTEKVCCERCGKRVPKEETYIYSTSKGKLNVCSECYNRLGGGIQ